MIKKTLFFMASCFVFSSLYLSTGGSAWAAGTLQLCDIAQGKIRMCQGLYSGSAVVNTTGTHYQRCSVALGKKQSCSGPYTGESVLFSPQGEYELCFLKKGYVTSCQPHFTGHVVVERH
ncbi:hypothetical protein [Entomobacter blattae]|uniref:Uncharacterized protein n=1 Tax=Entomobacter blattae TaxID=2762277 RepID=A0A7H1NPE2_9PROT|nr:hypothetical protein [Entomobacter blattae]QNT77652.1 hypothetical protein JGUZn3_04020 [Entomobacter blattae]